MLKRLSAGGFMRPVGQGARLESTIYVGGLVPLDAANGLDRAAPGEAARVDVHESSWTSSAVSVVEPTTLGTGCRCFELGENVDLRRRCTSNPTGPHSLSGIHQRPHTPRGTRFLGFSIHGPTT